MIKYSDVKKVSIILGVIFMAFGLFVLYRVCLGLASIIPMTRLAIMMIVLYVSFYFISTGSKILRMFGNKEKEKEMMKAVINKVGDGMIIKDDEIFEEDDKDAK